MQTIIICYCWENCETFILTIYRRRTLKSIWNDFTAKFSLILQVYSSVSSLCHVLKEKEELYITTCLSLSLAASNRKRFVSCSPDFALVTFASTGGVWSKKLSRRPSPLRKLAKHSVTSYRKLMIKFALWIIVEKIFCSSTGVYDFSVLDAFLFVMLIIELVIITVTGINFLEMVSQFYNLFPISFTSIFVDFRLDSHRMAFFTRHSLPQSLTSCICDTMSSKFFERFNLASIYSRILFSHYTINVIGINFHVTRDQPPDTGR